MDFEQLKETLPDAKPQTFLQAILSQPQEEDAELTFSEEIDEQFVENCKILASPKPFLKQMWNIGANKNF